MEKLVKRSATAVRRTRSRAAKVAEKEMIRDRAIARKEGYGIRRARLDAVRQEKVVRREIWEIGLLSPYAHPSKWADTYGAWSAHTESQPMVPEAMRVKFWPVRTGDRVCVVEGHDNIKGRIGKILDIDEERESVLVKDVNKILMDRGAAATRASQQRLYYREQPISLKDVRLVYPLVDPATGVKRDVIINKIKREVRVDENTGKRTWVRVVHPQGIEIPFPPVTRPNAQDHEGDTMRLYTERETFAPTLLGPPMPETVIDELRNKFSKFRTRHEDEYVLAKQAQDAEAASRAAHANALKPQGAHNIARQGRASGRPTGSEPQVQPHLVDDIATLIGAHMAANGYGLKNGKVVPVAPTATQPKTSQPSTL